jgi:DNA polymerase III epsilon subunit family exonuclease
MPPDEPMYERPDAVNEERIAAVEAAVRSWSGQLVDLTARNNLLFFRDLKAGTLDFGDEPSPALFDVLAGRSVSISRLFPDPELRASAIKRARVIHNRSREHFEERGLETLFLACGMATWNNQRGAAVPSAPVLLCPARIVPRGAAQDEFELTITADAEVNQTLLQALESEFNCRCVPDELLESAGIEGAIDTAEELTVAYEWLRDQATSVPGFDVRSRFVLGTFAYAKLPMVKDLEGSVEAMVRHELIAALAGDEDAQAVVRERRATVDASQPDRTPPADEFLVLDADHSQNYAINALLAGQDLVIKGPPGTGKSQTIANLVSTLVARGKRVLFVAEKRAAIDAVLRRLDDVGLGDLVLDLHGGVGSRREVAQRLNDALMRNAQIARPRLDADHRLLQARRDELNAHVEALHADRPPWRMSLFEAQTSLLALDSTTTTEVRFRGLQLERLNAEAVEDLSDKLRQYIGLGGLALRDSGAPWARGDVVSSEQARDAHALVDALAIEQVPGIQARLDAASGACGLASTPSFAHWSERIDLWERISETLDRFDPAVYTLPLESYVSALAPLEESGAKRAIAAVTSGEYRSARKAVRATIRESVQPAPGDLLVALRAAAQELAEWKQLSPQAGPPRTPEDLAALAAAYRETSAGLSRLAQLSGRPLGGTTDELLAELHRLRQDTPTLAKLPELHQLRVALDAAGIGELRADLETRRPGRDQALGMFRYAWLTSIVDHVRLTDSRIAAFDGEQHTRTLAEFQAADRAHIETSAQRVRRACAERAVAVEEANEQQGALIRDQAARKRKHLSVRQLFAAAPDVMTSLKPCWAMSPLVVSQLLPGDQQYFEVVIFDEASQVRPAEAMPAILRGKRVVVAGDERQLPPTAFFTGADPELDTAEMEGRVVVDSGFESILEALLPFLGFRMLQWHYRSRDERLIAFSNAHLYNHGMTTFPGVLGADAIRHELVPFTPGEFGADDSTSAEVDRVVELIIEHAETRPDESLGVIAMGIKHADRIDESLRQVLRDRPDLEEFFVEDRPERFFVKNLERVQGDERDAIILTIGYGRTPDGRMRYVFGPLNQEGGERRLNVAITRAKSRMTLVSCFAATDMDPDRCRARGVDLLRLYLQYAATHGAQLDRQALETPALNPFEVDVRDALTHAGMQLIPQFGASGYRIDFAVKHPTEPGRMVLAIETDGASYHSSPTARDRDRLRQEHLERLGWRFHRIWSQDWFTNRDRETRRAFEAFNEAVRRADDDEEPPPAPDASPRDAAAADAARAARGPRPSVPYGQKIDEYSAGQLDSVVAWIESDTLLRTRDQVLAEAMTTLGFQKRGKRIVAALNDAIDRSRGSSRTSAEAVTATPPPRSNFLPPKVATHVPTRPPGLSPAARRNGGLAANRLPVDEVVVSVIDTETTGLTRHDRLVEIAIVKTTLGGDVLDVFETLINPGRTVGDTTHIHGISDRDLLDAPTFSDVAGAVAQRLDGTIWAAHNAPFDVRFLNGEFERLGLELPAWPTICTMRMARLLGTSAGARLTDCCADYGVPIPDGLHSASVDARITARLLSELARARHCTTLGELGICDGDEWLFAIPHFVDMPNGMARVHLRGQHTELTIGQMVAPAGLGATDEGMSSYLAVLADAMQDRRIERHELDTLFATATREGLSPRQTLEAHATYLSDVAAQAYADGVLTAAERRDIERVGRLLELDEPHVHSIVAAEAAAGGRPPQRGALVGATVCFTGELQDTRGGVPITREDAHALAAQAGLVPVRSVTRGLDLLVVADPYTVSRKAEKARASGVRVMAAEAFWTEAGIDVD